jgi:hypothetical protein
MLGLDWQSAANEGSGGEGRGGHAGAGDGRGYEGSRGVGKEAGRARRADGC